MPNIATVINKVQIFVRKIKKSRKLKKEFMGTKEHFNNHELKMVGIFKYIYIL